MFFMHSSRSSSEAYVKGRVRLPFQPALPTEEPQQAPQASQSRGVFSLQQTHFHSPSLHSLPAETPLASSPDTEDSQAKCFDGYP